MKEVYVHDVGMFLREAVEEFIRLLQGLGYAVKVNNSINCSITAIKNGDIVKIRFKPGGRNELGIQRTIVEIECKKDIHEKIQKKLYYLRGGG